MRDESVLELTRRNAELTARVSELTRTLAQIEAFTKLNAGVVHDLRNAFQVTLVAAETLLHALEDPSDVELAEAIVDSSKHGTALARDLLTLARNEQGKASLVDGAESITRVQRLIQRVARDRVTCTFDIEPGVGEIRVERPQLEAALINLSVNARDAMPGGGLLRVGVRKVRSRAGLPPQLPPGAYIEFFVTDTGTGMPPSVLARATEAFFTTKQAVGGTGLGLAMAQSFASSSGGTLVIDSELKRGTTVKIILPSAATCDLRLDGKVHAKLDKIAGYIRTPALRDALQAWRTLCPTDGLPPPIATEGQLKQQSEHLLVLAVERTASPPSFRLLRMGDTLARALGSRALGDLPIEGSTALGTLTASYRRALEARFPSYEYASFSFDDGEPATFERLILPTSNDGNRVSHLLGVVRLSSDLEQRGKTSHVSV